ncbi:hypothetical protein BAPKO_4008 (plasmid) [Borreliella afzelii PKo]|nr:hypothetical protein BAPKO_4008 [Borreliella afzelii PKo]
MVTTVIPLIALIILSRISFKLVVWLAISMLLFAFILTVSEIKFKVFGLIALSM